MIHLREADNIYIDENLAGFSRKLAESGVVKRQVDLLLVGVAYAIRHQLRPLESIRSHDLVRVALLDGDVRIAIEAALAWYARKQGIPSPKTSKELLDLLARTGSAGLSALRNAWESLSPGQLRLRLLELARNSQD